MDMEEDMLLDWSRSRRVRRGPGRADGTQTGTEPTGGGEMLGGGGHKAVQELSSPFAYPLCSTSSGPEVSKNLSW